MRHFMILIAVLTLGLSGCGKKGDLAPPPGYPDEEPEQGQIFDRPEDLDTKGHVNYA